MQFEQLAVRFYFVTFVTFVVKYLTMKRRYIISAPVILIVAAVWWLWSGGEREDRLNLLLITLDTTRADHLGCYGYGNARTPAIDQLAQAGVRFNRFFCNVPLTLPSHATMMTGLYPPEHGCRVNGANRLGDDITTLAERFSSHGYRTGAFVAAFVLDSKFGLDRGFRTYDDYDVPTSNDIYDDNIMYRYRRADRVADAALEWLEEQSGEPFFCWVHFFDPHRPYYFSPAPGRGLSDAYDQEISFMDFQIGRLTGYLRERGLDTKTVVIVVGDHGEGLGDHGEEEHGLLLYNPVMRVPLIISSPGRDGAGGEVETLFSTVDLFPTILDIFGGEIPEEISGRSFIGALEGLSSPNREVYLETEFPLTEYGWSPLAGLISGEWKYVAAPREELYHLSADPGETENLAGGEPEKVRQLREELGTISTRMAVREPSTVKLDDRARKTLASLGYLGGGSAGKPGAKPLRDPKDAIGLRHEFISAVEELHRGETAAAEATLRGLIEQSPESYTFRFKLARTLYEQGRFEEALGEFREMTKLNPDEYKVHYNLGKTLNKLERYDEAIRELRLAVQLDPEQTPGHNNLGIALLKTGRIEEAMKAFNRSIEIDDRQVDPHNNLGNAFLSLGRVADAADEFRRSVEIDPDFFEGRYNLGLCLMKLGKNREATREFKETLRIRPDFSPARQHLADALRKGGDK